MRQSGVTLIELLVGLVLVTILASLAVPALGEIVEGQRRHVAAQQLANGLRAARVEAVTRNQVVMVHAIEDDWSNGWQIIENPSGRGAGDERNKLLTERAYGARVPIAARLRGNPYVSFNSMGVPSTHNGTLFICEKNQPFSHYEVIVAPTGRVRIESARKPQPQCDLQSLN